MNDSNDPIVSSSSKAGGSIYASPLPEMTGPYRARNKLLVNTLRVLDAVGHLHPRRSAPPPADRPMKILVANWGHLGDVVTILPLLDFLKYHPRFSEVGVLIGQWAIPVLALSDVAARTHVVDHWALDRSGISHAGKITRYLREASRTAREIRDCGYDVSIDTFSTFPATHRLTWRARIPCRIGFTSPGLGTYLSHPVRWVYEDGDGADHGDQRTILEHQLRLLEPLLGTQRPRSLKAAYPGFVRMPLPADKAPHSPRYLVLHVGSGGVRGWPLDNWKTLAKQLKQQGWHLVTTGASGTETVAASQVANASDAQNLAGVLSWPEFATLIADATGIITFDTVAGHLAACFDVPTVVLAAGRQRLGLWRPNNARARMMTHSVACAPCNRSYGCEAMGCIRNLDVREVISQANRLFV